jgi:hypothetical protein
MIIKHVIELETVINEDSNEPAIATIKAMPDKLRQQFFDEAGRDLLKGLLVDVNKGNTWAELRVASKESV